MCVACLSNTFSLIPHYVLDVCALRSGCTKYSNVIKRYRAAHTFPDCLNPDYICLVVSCVVLVSSVLASTRAVLDNVCQSVRMQFNFDQGHDRCAHVASTCQTGSHLAQSSTRCEMVARS